MITCVLVLIIFVSLIILYLLRLKKYEALEEYPGPTSLEVARLMLFSKSSNEIYNHFLELPKIYGPVVKLWIKPFRPALLVTSEKFVQAVLLSNEHVHKTDMYRLLTPVSGEGLATAANVNQWRIERKKLSSVFNPMEMAQYTLMLNNHTSKLFNLLKANQNKSVELQSLIHQYTVEVIFALLVAEDIEENDVQELSSELTSFLTVYFERVFSVYKSNDFVFRFAKNHKTLVESSTAVTNIFDRILRKQMKIRSERGSNGKAKADFLSLLLRTDLPYKNILDNFRTFIIAGLDTTAHAICFALFEIAKRRDVQQAMYNEYISIFGEDQDVVASYDDIQKMTYTNSVIKETLRLYPALPIIQRRLKSPLDIDGKIIPSDTDIYFFIISMHKSAKYESPLQFNPERFLPENLHKIPQHLYAPFSTGPRDCIGKRIALANVKFITSRIVRFFKIYPVTPEHKLELAAEMSLTSKSGVPVIFKERNNSKSI